MSDTIYQVHSIGIVKSRFKQKFLIPRQPGLVNTISKIVMHQKYSKLEYFEGLEVNDHIWVSFIFHKNQENEKLRVRPPRLGGNKRIGVFASRSSFRPNHIGLSCVLINDITFNGKNLVIEIIGGDFLDETPVIDIKPYVTYSDRKVGPEWCENSPEKTNYLFKNEKILNERILNEVKELISLDPMPAYKASASDTYKVRYDAFDIHYQRSQNTVTFLNCHQVQDN